MVRRIPYGKVTSYGAIAKVLAAARSARMVGWAMNASHNLEDVPAHRVVNRSGLLTGKHHFDGTNLMQQLLESEGIEVRENQIVDFDLTKYNFFNSVLQTKLPLEKFYENVEAIEKYGVKGETITSFAKFFDKVGGGVQSGETPPF